MYSRIATISTLVVCLVAIAWAFQVCFVRPHDLQRYRTFVQNQELASSTKKNATATDQKRQGVRKDIFFTQADSSRLHYRIESSASTLTMIPVGHKMEIVENLEKIKCGMQEKLFVAENQPMQQIRFLEAEQGIYRYATQQFIAQDVLLSLLRQPGHQLPSSLSHKDAFLKGMAESVSFAVSGKTPQFQAQHFQALLQKGEGS